MKRASGLVASGAVYAVGFAAIAWLMAEFAAGMAAAKLRRR